MPLSTMLTGPVPEMLELIVVGVTILVPMPVSDMNRVPTTTYSTPFTTHMPRTLPVPPSGKMPEIPGTR